METLPSSITAIVMGSVVPPLTPIMQAMTERYFGRDALMVKPGSNAGMPILYKNPEEVGADRIANSIAEYETYGKAQKLPLIIADLGTATTFDAVTAKGEYLGGVICPDRRCRRGALSASGSVAARRRPQAEVSHRSTTVGAVESGLFYGCLGMVEGVVSDDGRTRGKATWSRPEGSRRSSSPNEVFAASSPTSPCKG